MLQTDKPMQRSVSVYGVNHPDMALIPGGTFRWDRTNIIPRRRPRIASASMPSGSTDTSDQSAVQGVRPRHRPCHERRNCPRSKDYPGALPHMLYAGSLVFSPPTHPVDLSGIGANGGRSWRVPIGVVPMDQKAVSTSSITIRWCMSPMPMRSPMRIGLERTCRPKRNGSSRHAAGWRKPNSPGATIDAGRQASRQHLAGRISASEPVQRWFCTYVACQCVPAERLRPVRHDRQCLGMDQRFLFGRARGGCGESLLHSPFLAGAREQDSYDQCQPQIKIPRKVLKGGSLLCAPILSPLSSGRAPCRAGRIIDQPCRVQVRGPGDEGCVTTAQEARGLNCSSPDRRSTSIFRHPPGRHGGPTSNLAHRSFCLRRRSRMRTSRAPVTAPLRFVEQVDFRYLASCPISRGPRSIA